QQLPHRLAAFVHQLPQAHRTTSGFESSSLSFAADSGPVGRLENCHEVRRGPGGEGTYSARRTTIAIQSPSPRVSTCSQPAASYVARTSAAPICRMPERMAGAPGLTARASPSAAFFSTNALMLAATTSNGAPGTGWPD